MTSTVSKIVVLAALLFLALSPICAQPETASSRTASGEMFDGETLVYSGDINKSILRGISVAQLTFTASSLPNSEDLLIKTDAVSKGTLLRLFRYSFLQHYESTIDLPSFRILKTTKHDVQKERVRDSDAVFDYTQRRVVYVETDPKDKMRAPRRIASEIKDPIHDMVSAIYAVRLLPLAVGKKMELSVSDSGLVYKVPFTVIAREQQKTVLGKVWCYKIEPFIFGPGRLIERKGRMIIWMTEGERHVPVRAQIESEYGRVDIKLTSFQKSGSAPSSGN